MNETLRKVESTFLTKRTANARSKQSLRFSGSPLGLGNLVCNIRGLEEGLREARIIGKRKRDKSPEPPEGFSNAHSGIYLINGILISNYLGIFPTSLYLSSTLHTLEKWTPS